MDRSIHLPFEMLRSRHEQIKGVTEFLDHDSRERVPPSSDNGNVLPFKVLVAARSLTIFAKHRTSLSSDEVIDESGLKNSIAHGKFFYLQNFCYNAYEVDYEAAFGLTIVVHAFEATLCLYTSLHAMYARRADPLLNLPPTTVSPFSIFSRVNNKHY